MKKFCLPKSAEHTVRSKRQKWKHDPCEPPARVQETVVVVVVVVEKEADQ
jgi:hypothetical protein